MVGVVGSNPIAPTNFKEFCDMRPERLHANCVGYESERYDTAN